MKFEKWLETLITEKGVDMDDAIELEGHIGFTYAVLVEQLAAMPEHHEAIKTKLVVIDFKNGDVFHFLKYLAKGIADMAMAQF